MLFFGSTYSSFLQCNPCHWLLHLFFSPMHPCHWLLHLLPFFNVIGIIDCHFNAIAAISSCLQCHYHCWLPFLLSLTSMVLLAATFFFKVMIVDCHFFLSSMASSLLAMASFFSNVIIIVGCSFSSMPSLSLAATSSFCANIIVAGHEVSHWVEQNKQTKSQTQHGIPHFNTPWQQQQPLATIDIICWIIWSFKQKATAKSYIRKTIQQKRPWQDISKLLTLSPNLVSNLV